MVCSLRVSDRLVRSNLDGTLRKENTVSLLQLKTKSIVAFNIMCKSDGRGFSSNFVLLMCMMPEKFLECEVASLTNLVLLQLIA
jgi:hypothetical protein